MEKSKQNAKRTAYIKNRAVKVVVREFCYQLYRNLVRFLCKRR